MAWPRAALLAFSLALVAAAALQASVSELVVPEPRLEGFDEGARKQLVEARSSVIDAIAAEATAPELAESFGGLARLYDLYQLSDAAEVCWENAQRLAPTDYRWPYLLAVVRARDGRWPEVLSALDRVLELEPEDVPALLRYGRAALEAGQPEDARRSFAMALERGGGAAAARHGLGQVAFAEGDFETAVAEFERALAAQPEASGVRYELALAYRELGSVDRARAELEQAGDREVYFADPLSESLRSHGSGVAFHLVEGSMARSRGDYEQSRVAFERAVELEPANADARLQLAVALLQLEEVEAARAEFAEVLELDPENVKAAYNVGNLYAEAGELERALALLETAAQRAGEFSGVHRSLAAVLARLGRLDQAESRYREALALDPGDVKARVERARTLMRLGRAGEAQAELEQALVREPGNLEALFELGSLHEGAERFEEAVVVFERLAALDLEPARKGVVRFRLASLLAQVGDRGRAADELAKAVELVPDHYPSRLQLARLLAGTGRFVEAAEQFGAASKLDPATEEARFGEALSLMLAKSYPAALARLEASVRALPESVALTHMLARLLAACPDPAVRDGERALELAQGVLRQRPASEHAETVAMALAEVGRFGDARSLQAQIVEQARRAGRPGEAERLQRVLEEYTAGRPIRAPWLGGGSSR